VTDADQLRLGAIVLAAGAGRRFGGDKLTAPLRGRTILQHVLDAVADAQLAATIVVLGRDAERIESAIRWRTERRVVNPEPERGLAGSLRVGLGAATALQPPLDGIFVVLGDQPLLSAAVIAALAASTGRAIASGRSVVVPRYASGGGANPALLLRASWPLTETLSGDHGMGPLLAERREVVLEVPVPGANPDVDTRSDLEALANQG
jgi:molybdenum cofactor cytidylyltransferase